MDHMDLFPNNNTAPEVYIPLRAAILAGNSLVLACTFAVGVFGNAVVGWVVYSNRHLQTPYNALLLNLAANDLLKCLLDIPLFLVASVWGNSRADLGEALCLAQPFTYSLSSCVQLLTLVVISVERYQAIAFPFQMAKRRLRVKVWIPIVWSLGLALSTLSVTCTKRTPVYVRCRHLPIDPHSYFDPFGSYILMPVWVASLSLIVGHYLRIYGLVRQHRNKVFDCGIMPSLPSPKEQDGPGAAWQIVSDRHVKAATRGVMQLPANRSQLLQLERETVSGLEKPQSPSLDGCLPLSPQAGPSDPPDIVGAVCLITARSRENARKRVEGKLGKRFGYIILTFLIFWVPLITILLLNVFLQNDFSLDPLLLELETLAVALTCVPAAVNPFVYTVVNQHFHAEIQQIVTRVRQH
ncbi:gonadotropin-releasing hormone receptor-like [Callorhinchus milii]|uniref:gonadotropin-releasing hormone receptor-like n=1 Tax=Callorhinchus milii TaxID=7868 RepID=UPI001C3F5092|nr:gonadotropin-releasing hormone receptor-like [Callorhinchus milii]